jgi:catechol 2,3-dioxygenase-like lactoylglutathione lyase family enzyme
LTVQLDHVIVPSRNQVAAAKLLAELLGVAWVESGIAHFSPVYVNDGLTLDFQTTDEDFPIYHFCFRVSDAEFDAVLARIDAAGIKYRSGLRGPADMQVGTQFGGRGIYWNEPDAHQWEMLTVSYARPITT